MDHQTPVNDRAQAIKAEFETAKTDFAVQVKNGAAHLPDYLLWPDEAGKYHLVDRFGRVVISDRLNLSRDTLLSLLEEAGASYKEITFSTPPPPEVER